MVRPIPFVALLLFIGTAATQASDDTWVGQMVLPRRPDVKFLAQTADGDKREFEMAVAMTRVLSENDGWLVVYAPGTESRVKKSDMVLLNDADSFYTEYVRDNPVSAWGFDRRGIARRMHGDFENAIKDFSESIRLEPTAAHYNNRGTAWSAKRDFDKAIEDYNAAIRADEKCVSAFSNRGIAWWSKREPDKAMLDFEEAVRLDPNDVNALTNRGFALYLQQNYEKAIHDFDESIRIDPKYVNAIGNKATALVKLKKYSEAMQSFAAALRLSPVDWVYRDFALFRASCPDAQFRDGEKAVELAKKSIELAGSYADSSYHGALAAAYAEGGDFEKAMAAQQTALKDKTLIGEERASMENRLENYRRHKPFRDGK
jgi:tetratricopeptide (TPR) repeat protein